MELCRFMFWDRQPCFRCVEDALVEYVPLSARGGLGDELMNDLEFCCLEQGIELCIPPGQLRTGLLPLLLGTIGRY